MLKSKLTFKVFCPQKIFPESKLITVIKHIINLMELIWENIESSSSYDFLEDLW